MSFIDKECAVCKTVTSFASSGVLTMNEHNGLDGKPANLTPLYSALNICPKCNYSAPNIEQGSQEITQIVKTKEYQELIKNSEYSDLVKKFIGWAYIQDKLGQECEAARSMLCATWLSESDSNNSSLASSKCRHKTIEYMSSCKGNCGNYEMTHGKELITIIDIYRRESEFETALEICKLALSDDTISEEDEFYLRYEEKLCRENKSTPQTHRDAESNY